MKLRMNEYRVLVIPDLQIPFHHKDAFNFLSAVCLTFGCDRVVSIGDEVDQYNLSRYDKDPDAMGAGDEYEVAMSYLEELYQIFPEVDAVHSNHLDRVAKRALGAGIPKAYLKDLKEWMGAPDGWNWYKHVTIGGVRYEHGDASNGARAHRILAEANRCSTVIGHHHSHAGVEYISNGNEVIFAMNVGSLIDADAVAFQYNKSSKYKPVLSCGVVLNGVPSVVPMLVNGKGRWTGDIVT